MAANEAVGHTESEKTSSYKTVVQLKIKWRIEKFETLMESTKPGEGRLWSEDVSSKLAPHATWKLTVDPNGCEEEERGNIGVDLWLTGQMANRKEIQQATLHLYLVDGSKNDSIGRSTSNFGEGWYAWGWNMISHDRVRKALQADGSLVVAADVQFSDSDDGGSAKVICEASTLQGYEDLQQWAAKFSELHGNEASSDCTIQIGGVSIPAHKCILAAHSPIFRSMFTHQEAEEFQSSTIKVTDFNEPEPMRALVRYCYQGQLDTTTMDGEGAVEVFKLADRYCVAGLKSQLEKHFADKRLTVENVVSMAVLADMHSARKLNEACTKLIAQEWKTVSASADWKELGKAKMKLAFQLAVGAATLLTEK